VDKEILEIAKNTTKISSYHTLKMACRHRNREMQMKYCCKIYASYRRQSAGIESEILDLLQGRVPKSVFARHYFTPSLSYRQKVLEALNELKKEIEKK
jgi:intergrase/recombinase